MFINSLVGSKLLNKCNQCMAPKLNVNYIQPRSHINDLNWLRHKETCTSYSRPILHLSLWTDDTDLYQIKKTLRFYCFSTAVKLNWKIYVTRSGRRHNEDVEIPDYCKNIKEVSLH